MSWRYRDCVRVPASRPRRLLELEVEGIPNCADRCTAAVAAPIAPPAGQVVALLDALPGGPIP